MAGQTPRPATRPQPLHATHHPPYVATATDTTMTLTPGPAAFDRAFRTARAARRAALAAYYPVGFPTVEQSLVNLQALAQHADVVEVGLPFSDPVLDGPTIQQATRQALDAGFRMKDLFTAVRAIRTASRAAVLVMTYWQPVADQVDRFAADLAEAGAAGALIPDLPLEEAGTWLAAARRHGLHAVPLAPPTASDEHLARICAAASGMIYAPATSGVTGHTGPLAPDLPAFVDRLCAYTRLPISVGIGISNAD
ncbi:tryptophan synthase alpha chain [Streptomyces filamentosus]|uniref:tryptophan synthase n=2 Tax=Streptomyces filamentosus TaxID=67294 RepID=A0A919BSQ6_STRFL|nr:tryptophan synthase alpha chain [Streptomyces filamentosus]